MRKISFLISLFLILPFFFNNILLRAYQNEPIKNGISEKIIIKSIKIIGLKLLPKESILNKITFQVDEEFDQLKISQSIKNIHKLGYFKQIEILEKKIKDKNIELTILITEKKSVISSEFFGNKRISKEDLLKKTDIKSIVAIDEKEISKYEKIIEKLYKEKNYHFAKVKGELLEQDNNTFKLIFEIDEGHKVLVNKVRFSGNNNFGDKKLRSLLFTREDWILGALDRSGTYNIQAIEADKYTIETFYQNNGFIYAKVIDSKIEYENNNKNIIVTFIIDEGEQYNFGNINIISSKDQDSKNIDLTTLIPIKNNMLYSKELIRISIERLRTFWGNKGYIYSDIQPLIEPNDKTKLVNVSFETDLGNQIYLNRISIFGNKKTRDKVIRRQILLKEGDLLKTSHMDISKEKIEHLHYFDQTNGVNWKINRLDDNNADLDILVKEIKTGKCEFRLNYGGSPRDLSSMSSGATGEINLAERNIFGKGLVGNAQLKYGQDERSVNLSLTQPWLMDKPVSLGFEGFYSKSEYDEIRKIKQTISERYAGGSINLGFILQNVMDTMFMFQFGLNSISHKTDRNNFQEVPQADISTAKFDQDEFQLILNERFKGGNFLFLKMDVNQDTRNSMTHVSRGHKLLFSQKIGIPSLSDNIGFYKGQLDTHFYTPLINEYSLVLHFHGTAGIVKEFENTTIPYRELFHTGGPASVRGWNFGQIGPLWFIEERLEDGKWRGEPIGAKKTLFLNSELIFPITNDMSFKGVVFYDGGAGWDTPRRDLIKFEHLANNSLDYRHSIGIGIRSLAPTPFRVDWGFKLDKREGESPSEVHFSAYYDF